MSDIIHLLPDHIANQIAAGEVIQRPASVVKELVENSIDAGAERIQVNIKDAGRTLIQVIDNGVGMSEADARMAFERHATSKISTAEDLFSLKTMGFRGEALASIAAVAHLELRTRLRGTDVGVRLSIAGSDLTGIGPDACAEGSVFSIKNLFFNVPARRKFLKSNDTEFRNILNEFERIALVNPQIELSLTHNDVEILSLPAGGIRQRIIDIFGKTLNQKLISIDVQSNLVTISGFVGKPDSVKKRGALQYFFVNGRFMKHPYFHKAVMQAYENIIPAGEMPSYFIYFTLDPQSIDVNIHPTKTEIKFEHEQPIWQILVAAVRESLAKASTIPMIDFDREDVIDIPVYGSGNGSDRINPPTVHVNKDYNPFKTSNEKVYNNEFDWSKLYNDFESTKAGADQEIFIEDEVPETKDHSGTMGDLLGTNTVAGKVSASYQYKEKYIITSLKSGLVIIDQHRAHYRVLFEQYMNDVKQRRGVGQQLLFPEIIELTTAESAVLSELMDELHFLGFDMASLGNNTYAINAVPERVDRLDPVVLIRDIIDKAMEYQSSAKDDLSVLMASMLARAGAINYGKPLSVEEMDHLTASLFSCEETRLTPDGKNILSVINDDELDKRFR